jgi:protein TonB
MAFLPAVAIHLGFVAALGVLFGLVDSERLDVLPVMLMASSAPSAASPPPPEKPMASAEPAIEAPRPKASKRSATKTPAPLASAAGADVPQAPMVSPEPAVTAVSAEPSPVIEVGPAPAPEPGPPPEPVADLSDRLAQIRAKIQQSLVYPPMAKLKGIEGTATIRFDVDGSGNPKSVKVSSSSGFDILDQAAVQTVKAAAPYPLVEPTVKVPVVFELH